MSAAVLALFTGLVTALFAWRQRRTALGGAMAPAKALWLGLVVYAWFLLSPLLAVDKSWSYPARAVFVVIALLMWLRAPVELYLLYIRKSWRPPYGIAHTTLTAVGAACALWFVPAGERLLPLALLASLVMEIVHARSFHDVVGDNTTGADGIWFADSGERFSAILWRTRIFNALFIVMLASGLYLHGAP